MLVGATSPNEGTAVVNCFSSQRQRRLDRRINRCDSVMNVSSVPREEMNVDIGRSGGEKNMLGENVEAEVIEGSTEKIVLESAVMLNTAKHDMKMDKIEGFTIDKRRTNLTFNGITYNCTKCTRGKLPDEFTKYYSCTMVYRECEGKWKPRRQTKDKVDSDKEKCGGTLVVHYTHSDNFVVKARTEHRCSGQS